MSLFGFGKSSDRYGVLIDIGSGSVLTAIVHSRLDQAHPNIIWAHREQVPLRNIESLEQSGKSIIAALVDACMLLDSEGRKALQEVNASARLSEVQCGISAPWSYTITKTINYKQDESFRITNELIDDLLNTINSKIESDLQNDGALQNLGLEVTTYATMDILSNGYRITDPEGGQANQLTVSRASVVAQGYMIDALNEIQEKLFANTTLRKISYILMLSTVTKELFQASNDYCLVDITYEATEIGIVRDGVLTYCTHTPFGSFSLAREIAAALNVPLYEAFGYLHNEKPFSFKLSLTSAQQREIDEILEAYTEKVSGLFHETGDELSIPKRIILHSDLKSETLFSEIIEKAAKRAIKSEPFITLISEEIFKQRYKNAEVGAQGPLPSDTAMLVSAQFFHNKGNRSDFEYL